MKRTAERGGRQETYTNSRVEGQSKGRLAELKDVGKNDVKGRTVGEQNGYSCKLAENWKEKLESWK